MNLVDQCIPESIPDTFPEEWAGGGNGCDHRDLFPGCVEEGEFHTTVWMKCRGCGENFAREYGHGRDGAEA